MGVRQCGLVCGLLALGLLGAACSADKDSVGGTGSNSNKGDGDDDGRGDGDEDDDDRGDGDGGDGDILDEDPGEGVLINDCKSGAAGLTDAQIDALKKGGDLQGSRLLYPYDGTVFPRGLEGPQLMWELNPKADAVYLHIKSKGFEYEGCLKPSADNAVIVPKKVWQQAGVKTRGLEAPFAVELSLLAGNTAVGPLKQSWTIARATIKGSIYYNSYLSTSGGGIPGGKVFRIPPGGKFEPFSAVECNGCHSVSANGARMTSQTLATLPGFPVGRTYNIEDGTAKPLASPTTAPYTALYPDGSVYVQPSLGFDVARTLLSTNTAAALLPDLNAALYETDTGKLIENSGIPQGALMPSFSSDGSLLVFTDNGRDADEIGMVSFDIKAKKASDYRSLYKDPADTRPGWPFILPDNKGVIFVRGGGDFSGNGAGVFGGFGADFGPYSELFSLDIKTGKATVLARAMGFHTAEDATAGKTYMPFGNADIKKAYFPTVSPVAAGGFFWVFYDAVRHYGNLGQQRALWGTAIEISPEGDYSVDRSHPPFYIPGQELNTGNHRAFTALDPCKADGDKCTSGVDCCGGYCTFPEDEGEFTEERVGTCASNVKECSSIDERCRVDTDCCPGADGKQEALCISGYCSILLLL